MSQSFLLRAHEIEAKTERHSHPMNPLSEIHGVRLAKHLGLQRIGVSIARIPPGKESFVYHSHTTEEEWLYILSGEGVALIDGQEFTVRSGDFMAFPVPSVAHHLMNRSEQDLVYLMGGENREVEIADFPLLGKRLLKTPAHVTVHSLTDGQVLFQSEKK